MIGLRLSEDETARVDAWGERHGMNRSDAIRAMIREVLDRGKGCGKRR
jgi:metal-responsive CopG/Arc/MetJ family transcriptional regulator